jgi:hypothetical protein
LALGVISIQPVILFRFVGNIVQENGIELPTYAPAVSIAGSVQAVSGKTKLQLGLEITDEYVNLFTTELIRPVERDTAGDVFVWSGKYYQALGGSDWVGQDGWNEVLAIKIPNLTQNQITFP